MADNKDSIVVKVTTEGDVKGLEKVNASLEKLKTGTKKASDGLETAARSAKGAAERVATSSTKASGAVEKFSKSCQTSTRQVISSIGQWVTGFGLFEITNKLWGAYKTLKQMADNARAAAIKAATEIEKANGEAALRRVTGMAEAQREVADAIARQAQHQRELNSAKAEAEDSAYGQQIAMLNMEEQEALSQLDPDDEVGRARVSYDFSTRRRQIDFKRQEAVAVKNLENAETDESAATKMLDQRRSDYSVNSAEAEKTLKEMEHLKSFLADPHAVSLAGQRAWRESGGAGGLSGLNRAVETSRAAASARLETLTPVYDEKSAAAEEAANDIKKLEGTVETAGVRRQTAAVRLATVRETVPGMNVALARTEYNGVVETEKKAEAARNKKAEEERQRAEEERRLARDSAALEQRRAEKAAVERQQREAQDSAAREAEEAARAASDAEGARMTYGDRPRSRAGRETVARLDDAAAREAEEANSAARRAAAVMTQTAAALKALDQGIAQLENSVKTLSRKQNTAKGDITAGD